MLKNFTAQKLSDYTEVAKYIVALMEDHSIFLLIGQLGAGKTTLVQKICDLIDSQDVVSSPTFALINPYKTSKGMVYHMDMYRINDPEEAIDFGIEEYLWDGHYCFIEWPEKADHLIPEEALQVTIQVLHDDTRKIHFGPARGH